MSEKLRLVSPSTSPSSGSCEICGGSGLKRIQREGHSGVAICECRKRKTFESKMGVIGERFRNCSFESYIPEDEKQTAALQAMRERPGGNFYLSGGYRRGKTHLMVAQYRTLVEADQSCLFVTMSELLYELRRKENEPEYFSLVADRVKYAEGFHLFIDDLDKFKPTDFKDQALYNLIDTIYRRKLGLTVTTNLSLSAMAESERLDPAIIRRIDDMCEVIAL